MIKPGPSDRFPKHDMLVRLFHASLERVSEGPAFMDRFYDLFVNRSETIAQMFRHHDMARIKHKLKTTLEMVAGHADGQLGLSMYFELLGKVHRRHQVSAAMFRQWRETLIQAVAELDPYFDAQTRAAWECVIDEAVRQMHPAPPTRGNISPG